MVLRPYRLPQDEQEANRVSYAAYWGARSESPADIAERVRLTLLRVRGLGSLYGAPFGAVLPDGWSPVAETPGALDDLVTAGYETGLDGTPYLPGGTDLLLLNRPAEPGGISVTLTVRAGCAEPGKAYFPVNQVHVSASSRTATDYSVVREAATPDATRGLVEDLVSIWAPDLAVVTTSAAVEAQHEAEQDPVSPVGAVTWFSDLVWSVPPRLPGAEVERFGQGALVSVGTRARPSLDTGDIRGLHLLLADAGLRTPAPTTQARAPEVPQLSPLAPGG